jgi:hypothetical protein
LAVLVTLFFVLYTRRKDDPDSSLITAIVAGSFGLGLTILAAVRLHDLEVIFEGHSSAPETAATFVPGCMGKYFKQEIDANYIAKTDKSLEQIFTVFALLSALVLLFVGAAMAAAVYKNNKVSPSSVRIADESTRGTF